MNGSCKGEKKLFQPLSSHDFWITVLIDEEKSWERRGKITNIVFFGKKIDLNVQDSSSWTCMMYDTSTYNTIYHNTVLNKMRLCSKNECTNPMYHQESEGVQYIHVNI